MKVLVTGASGFIGSRLVNRLSSSASSPSNKLRIICITRYLWSLKSCFPENVDIVEADVMNYQELVKAMTGIEIAYYLIHSMFIQGLERICSKR
jgi:nucleoside-diphosphate-sugar epimerase